MNFDKAKIQKELDELLLKKKIFLIISISLFVISFALAIIYAVMVIKKTIADDASVVLSVISDITFCAAIVMLVLRSALYSYKINVRRAILDGQIQMIDPNDIKTMVPPIVDVKEVHETHIIKTKEQELVDQYEDLYKKGYITKEDFEAKKKEILG